MTTAQETKPEAPESAQPLAFGSTVELGGTSPERATMPQITHVAIKYSGRVWSLPAPNRHHDVIRHIARETGDGIRGPDVQGFLDDAGRFFNRAQAYELASLNGQLRRKPGGYQGTDLYSEDLW